MLEHRDATIWVKVFEEIRELLEANIGIVPKMALLLMVENCEINNTKKEMVMDMIIVARLLIAKYCAGSRIVLFFFF